MKHLPLLLQFVSAACLALLVACGSRESAGDASTDADASGGSASTRAGGDAAGGEPLAVTLLPEGSKLLLRFSGSVVAGRNQVDADPLGRRSDFKVSRTSAVTCRMVVGAPRGIGPDGPTAAQKAIIDGATAQSQASAEEMAATPGMAAIEARIEACGDDEGCRMQAALDIASDPQQQRTLQAASERNAALASQVEDASARATAVYTEPNWMMLFPDTSGGADKPVCDGTITTDDREVYRFGFDGGDMGEGVETRKGETPLADSPSFYVWYDLKRGGLIVDVQLNSIRGKVESVNVGARKTSRNAGFGLNEDWAASAGETTRFQRASGVAAIPGKWTFALPIKPEVHQGFSGKIEAEISIAPR